MTVEVEVLTILDEVLSLQGRANRFDRGTPLLGVLPEFDSMAVVGVITAIEDRFDLIIDDDEIEASVFESVGTLTDFVVEQL